jgi:hypothetical protein
VSEFGLAGSLVIAAIVMGVKLAEFLSCWDWVVMNNSTSGADHDFKGLSVPVFGFDEVGRRAAAESTKRAVFGEMRFLYH